LALIATVNPCAIPGGTGDTGVSATSGGVQPTGVCKIVGFGFAAPQSTESSLDHLEVFQAVDAVAGVVDAVVAGVVVDVGVVAEAIEVLIAARTSYSALPPQLVTCVPLHKTAHG